MRKKMILMWSLCAAMTFSACTENTDVTPEVNNVDFSIQLGFEGSTDTRATKSTAIPETSWNIIKEVQFFLYATTGPDAGVVKFSSVETPNSGVDAGTGKKYTYTTVPEGSYTLVAVASTNNRGMDKIVPYGAGNNVAWTKFNVLDKSIDGFKVDYKSTSWPTFLPITYTGETGMAAFEEPAEIFWGTATVTVTENATVSASVSLKREVSLMRVRLSAKDNSSTVDFTKDASILIRHLPNEWSLKAGNDYGVAKTSTLTDVQVIEDGTTLFKTANPAANTGYGTTPGVVLDAVNGFTMWRDIIVFPNSGRGESLTGDAVAARKYLITITGEAKAGHKLADGTTATAGDPVYWSGIVDAKFLANEIREVNITLNTGGYTDITVSEFGELNITVSEPAKWSDNIVVSDMNM